MADKIEIFLHAALIRKIEEEYRRLAAESTSVMNNLNSKFGCNKQNSVPAAKMDEQLDWYYFGGKERIRSILLEMDQEKLEELDSILYNCLRDVNKHGDILSTMGYRDIVLEEYYSPLIGENRAKFSPYIAEVEANIGSYTKGFAWLGESHNPEEDSARYYYKIYERDGSYYLMRLLAKELKDDADYPEEVIISSNPDYDGELLFSPASLEEYGISSAALADVYEQIDNFDDAVIVEKRNISSLENEVKKMQQTYWPILTYIDTAAC